MMPMTTMQIIEKTKHTKKKNMPPKMIITAMMHIMMTRKKA